MIAAELDTLIAQPIFSQYEVGWSPEELDVPQTLQMIKTYAPTWSEILSELLRNPRAQWQSYRSDSANKDELDQKGGIVVMLTAMICHSKKPRGSNLFARSLGVYLSTSGVKTRVIRVLHGLGICEAASTIRSTVLSIVNVAKA